MTLSSGFSRLAALSLDGPRGQHEFVGVSATHVYGFAATGRVTLQGPVFRVERDAPTVTVHQRLNLRVLELADAGTGHTIALEGHRMPVTHTHDVIDLLRTAWGVEFVARGPMTAGRGRWRLVTGAARQVPLGFSRGHRSARARVRGEPELAHDGHLVLHPPCLDDLVPLDTGDEDERRRD
jgi:hypothetical protein